MEPRERQVPDPTESQRSRTDAESSAGAELPRAYGHSRLVVLVVDPFHLHAYWEMALEDRVAALERFDGSTGGEPEWVLRFYDVTFIEFDGQNAHGSFDIAVAPSARNWYVTLWAPEKSYFAELGLRGGAEFVPVCRSNFAHVPRAAAPERSARPPEAIRAQENRSSSLDGAGVSGEEYARAVRADATAGQREISEEPPAENPAVPGSAPAPMFRAGEAGDDSVELAVLESGHWPPAPAAANAEPSRSVSLSASSGSGSSSARSSRETARDRGAGA